MPPRLFIHSKFCIDRCREFFPRTSHGDVALIFFERGRHRCTHARVPKKNHRKKKARAFCLLSSFFAVARKSTGEKRSRCPKTKGLCFCLSTIITLRCYIRSLTATDRQTDIFERKRPSKKTKKKNKKKYARFLFFGRWF